MPQYPNPPIIQAAIEVRFETSIDADAVKKIAKALKPTLAVQREQTLHEIEFTFSDDNPHAPQQRHDVTGQKRVHLSDNDAEMSALIGPDNLVVSRMPPYTKFEELIDFYTAVWKECYRVTKYRKIGRVGMRYINRLDVPFTNGKIDHGEYLNVILDIPKGFDSVITYQFGFDRAIDEIGGIAKIQSATGKAALIDHMSFFLDIDVIALRELPQKEVAIVDLLHKMRDIKNEMFEAFITDKTRALFRG